MRLRRLLRLRRGDHDGYRRVCVTARLRRGGARVIDFCGLALRHPVINASGCFDAIAAQRVFGAALLERFPFAAYVSKTITLAPREGNPPPRLWEASAGLINSIGLPNRGPRRIPRTTTCRSSPRCRCR